MVVRRPLLRCFPLCRFSSRPVCVSTLLGCLVLLLAASADAQLIPATRGASTGGSSGQWKKSTTRLADTRAADTGAPVVGVTQGDVALPNAEGQIWREYDIRPYTTRVEGVEKPEIAVKDWILRETGTEVWFHEPLGILSVSREKVRVYHTPEMHKTVQHIIEQFVTSRPEPHALGIRLVTLQSPNWRIRALPLMEPVEVHSAGVEAWLVSRENAVLIYRDLKRRSDFQEHSGGEIPLYNGQAYTIRKRQPRRYVKTVRSVRDPFPAHKPEMGEIDEGYSLDISALFDEQSRSVDTVIRCNVDQIERLVPVTIDLPGLVNQRQRIDIQVPQMVSWRLHERFVWPEDKVLVLSCGVVAAPEPQRSPLAALVNLPVATPLNTPTGRADAVLMIEHNGTASQSLIRTDRTSRAAPNNHGRY